jgi:XTP/dITP diphosphohydrolase
MVKSGNMRIVLATNNLDKVRELRDLLSNTNFEIKSQAEFKFPEVAETGLTFVENAILKARHAAFHTNLPALADDSGLMVDALNGKPGIHSARFAGDKADYAENREKLLSLMRGIPFEKRTAKFCCTLVYLKFHDDPLPIICQGLWEGLILDSPKGKNGFGYDPIFFVKEYNSSASELPLAIKNKISHRGQALRQMLLALQTVDKKT